MEECDKQELSAVHVHVQHMDPVEGLTKDSLFTQAQNLAKLK